MQPGCFATAAGFGDAMPAASWDRRDFDNTLSLFFLVNLVVDEFT